jgi:radical SAM protein with 4Fe4S-binding SPASM domain
MNKNKRISFIEKNKKRSKLIDILPLKMPLGLNVEPTNMCNFRCVQCALSLKEFNEIVGKRRYLSMNLYKKIVKDIKSMGKLNNLNLYGDGEPLLHPDIVEMIKIAKKYDIANAITITTNASLLTNDLSNNLINSGLDYLRISVYSIYDNQFKKITQTKYNADLIYNNVARLFKNRMKKNKTTPFIYVKMIDTYGKENEEFLSKYSSISDEVNIETPMNWTGYKNIDLIGKIDKNHQTNTKTLEGYYGKQNISNYKRICTTPFLSLTIKSDGDVCVCIVDWNRGTKVGNIARSSLSEIWYGKKLREFRKMQIEGRRHENESCKNCDFIHCNPDNMDNFTSEKYNEILNYKKDL